MPISTSTATLAPVVVAVGRGGSDTAVRFGADEARRTGRPLDLVHVAPAGDGWTRMLGRDSLRVAAERARAVAGDGTVVSTELVRGSVVSQLLRSSHASALLVMERRRSAVRRRRDASTTAAIADITDVVNVVVPGDWTRSHRGVVTVGLDPLATDDLALRTAMVLARLRRAALRVVVVDTTGSSWGMVPLLDRHVQDRLQRLGSDACDIEIEIDMAPADAEHVLLDRAATSDLIVVGRHRPLHTAGSRLGPVAQAVLRHATCPILLTPPENVHTYVAPARERGRLAGGPGSGGRPGPRSSSRSDPGL